MRVVYWQYEGYHSLQNICTYFVCVIRARCWKTGWKYFVTKLYPGHFKQSNVIMPILNIVLHHHDLFHCGTLPPSQPLAYVVLPKIQIYFVR